jgi:hypothetical protein
MPFMNVRILTLALLAAAIAATGCRKPEPAAAGPAGAPLIGLDHSKPAATLARIYWTGKDRISADTNASAQNAVWNLPESRKLEAHALDQLARAPWVLLGRNPDTNGAALLRPLAEDALRTESYAEIRQAGDGSRELVFAARLNGARAAGWETRLASVLESITGIRPSPAAGPRPGWTLRKHHQPDLIEFVRADGWIVLGAGHDRNRLLDDVLARIRRDKSPCAGQPAGAWFSASLDLPRLASAFGWSTNFPANLPAITFVAERQGSNIVTTGSLLFPEPLNLRLQPWIVPTNLIADTFTSLTCVRGIQSWLASTRLWRDLQTNAAPDQLYVWALPSLPMQTYFAAPLPDASNRVSRLTDLVLDKTAAFFGSNDLGGFRRSETNGLEWNGVPYVSPYLQSVDGPAGPFVFGGMFPSPNPDTMAPGQIPRALSLTNLVYYDWEATSNRMDQWMYMGQFIRWVCNRAQEDNPVSLLWLMAPKPTVGPSETEVTIESPNGLSFHRESTLGLTAIELNLLVDWIDSPHFPVGLHSALAQPPPPAAPAGNGGK